MELSINFVVILIFSIVIFTLSLALIYKFFAFAEETQESIDEKTKAEILRRLIQANDQVAIPQNKEELKVTQFGKFGLGIRNVFSTTKEFGIKMEFVEALTLPNEEIFPADEAPDGTFINENWLASSIPSRTLKPTETMVVPLSMKVGAEMADGLPTKKNALYIFNVCVFIVDMLGSTGKELGPDGRTIITEQCRPNAGGLYTGRVYKAYVEVR